MGGEALRVLLDHPEVELAWATSRQPGPIEDAHPNLYGSGIRLIHPDEATPCDVVYLALPTAATFAAAQEHLDLGAKIIDLGSAFRLKDQALWEAVYGMPHPAWHVSQQAVYGVSELHAQDIATGRVIANPGCFSSAAILGLAPLVDQGRVEINTLSVSGLSGTAGVGAELSRAAHHPEIGNNLVPYNAVAHRHTFEMEQELNLLCGQKVQIHFVPVYVPITRGILCICRGFLTRQCSRAELLSVYDEFYESHPFVQVYDQPFETGGSWQYKPYPWVSAVTGTNYCQIGLDVDESRGSVVVFSVLDSIGKGGALAGVENMNLMFGLPRTAGLSQRGRHPN